MKEVLKTLSAILGITCYIMVILVCSKQAVNYFYDKHVQECYAAGDYSINENLLLTANYLEPYIAWYNNGNIAYQNKQYEEAIENYEIALEIGGMSKKRRCDIYINIALCKIALLPEDYEEYENIPESIEMLKEAQEVLYEDGCASEDDEEEGHSEEAIALNKEIQDEIDRLEEEKQAAEEEMSNDEKEQREKRQELQNMDEKQQEQYDKKDNDTRKQLDKLSENAQEEQQRQMERYEEQDVFFDYDDYENVW